MSRYRHPSSAQTTGINILSLMMEVLVEHLAETKLIEDDSDMCIKCREKNCQLVVMSCLHVLCPECLEEVLDSNGTAGTGTIACPDCKQETKIKGLPTLPSKDDKPKVEAQPMCSSCEGGMLATAKCIDCKELLCAWCFDAHKVMRCFKGHRVMDINNEVSGPKPMKFLHSCYHQNKKIELFCLICEIPVCETCVEFEHLSHVYVCLEDVFPKQKDELEVLLGETQENSALNKQKSIASVEKALIELNNHHLKAEDITFKKYTKRLTDLEKQIQNLLEKQELSLRQLQQFRNEEESKLTKMIEFLESNDEKLVRACEFTARLLKHGSALDILCLKKVVSAQLINLIDYPNPNVNFLSKFESIISAFEEDVTPSDESGIMTSISPAETNARSSISANGSFTQISDESVIKRGNDTQAKPVFNGTFSEPDPLIGKVQIYSMGLYRQFGEKGSSAGQLNKPNNVCVGWNGDIIVADSGNRRVQVFNRLGLYKFQIRGNNEETLCNPLKVAVFRNNGDLLVGDCGFRESRLLLFSKTGSFIRKIQTRLAIVSIAGQAVTKRGNIVVVDKGTGTGTGRIVVISENDKVLLQFDYMNYVAEPSDIMYHGNEFYVCDLNGSAVVVFGKDGSFKRRITRDVDEWYPGGVDITNKGIVLIGSSEYNYFRVTGFSPDGWELYDFHSPTQLSTCCGLKITPDGNAVTVTNTENFVLVAKNKMFKRL